MWLEGTTADGAVGRNRATHTHKNRYSCSLALPKRSISFFDIIICVITYEAIKQTSVPISSPSVCPLFLFRFLILFSAAICAPIGTPLLFLFNLFLTPLLSYHLLCSPLPSTPSAPLPPLLCDSRQGFNFSMLIVSLPTLCMSNTYWHSGDRQYTP